MLIRRVSFIIIGLLLLWVSLASADSSLPANFTETVFASGFDAPTTMRFAPDGRLFVLEQNGVLWIVDQNGDKQQAIDLVTDNENERGLLGIAFDPNFGSNGYVYLYYTIPEAGSCPSNPNINQAHNRVSRFTLSGSTISPASEMILMELDPLCAGNHNGGALNFGMDGELYVAVGDNAVSDYAQSLDTRHGKILRVNSDGSIPTDNPFYNQTTGVNRAIWALGLRNPFNFTVHPITGVIYLNDVGQVTWEEINQGIVGANYGWPETEGDFIQGDHPNFTRPLYAYSHADGCSIIGAAFYNPTTATFPADYVGDYFFGDYCQNWIRRYDTASDSAIEFATNLTGGSMVDMVVSEAGDLYYVSRATSTVYRISYAEQPQAPVIIQQPESISVSIGESASFSCDASGTPAPTFQWQRGTTDIDGATSKTYTLLSAALTDSGATFRCVASNSEGTATSESATLTVIDNTLPAAEIVTPVDGTTYNGGQTISYNGTGMDAEDGELPASAFTWEVVFHHADHTHPFIPAFSGVKEGMFTIPNSGHPETNVWYRIHLTVTDSDGAQHQVQRDVYPNLVNLTVDTNPTGLQITVDGQPHTAPYTTESVVGIIRQIGTISSQTLADTSYVFEGWSDSGALTHDVTTPDTTTTYTANFVVAQGTELLINGDFEMAANTDSIPDNWTNKLFARTKQTCNKIKNGVEKIVAHSGLCALQTKGVGSTGKLQQNITTTDYGAGDELSLSLWVSAKNAVAGAKVEAKVKYSDNTADKIGIDLLEGTYDYESRSASYSLPKEVVKIKVMVKNPTTGGRFRIDAVQLMAYSASSRLLDLPQ